MPALIVIIRVLTPPDGQTVDIDQTSPSPLVYAKGDDRVQPAETMPGTLVTVAVGDAVFFPPGSRYTFRHDAIDPAVVAFAVALEGLSDGGPLQSQTPSSTGDNTQENVGLRALDSALVGGPLAEMFADAAVSFGRALMAPKADIAFQETPGYAFVAVESGTLVLEVEHKGTLLEPVDAGAASVVPPGAAFFLHNIGDAPVNVMVATVVSTDSLPASLP